MGNFIMGLNVNIVTWNHFVNGMLFNLIKNLYVPFGISFDPKRYYKDGDCARMLRRPRAIRHMIPLPPRDQRHLWLRYQVVGYTKEIVHDFEQRLETIFGRQVNRVYILDFKGLTSDMRQDLAERMRMVYTRDDGQELGGARRRSERMIPDKGDLSDYWVEISSAMDFLRGAPSHTYIRDPVRRLCHRLISYNIFGRGQAHEKVTTIDLFYLRSMDRGAANIPYLLAQYLFGHAKGRKSGAREAAGAATGAPKAAEDAHAVDEVAQAGPVPVQAPQPPPLPSAAEQRLADLAAKKSTKLVKYQSSGILYVIEVMPEYRRIYNT
ncbi:hypothetical protein Tco_0995330, partial [Tanacetum coccineum]